jgi:hypothetical protein
MSSYSKTEVREFVAAYLDVALWSSCIGSGHADPEDLSLQAAGYEIDDIEPVSKRRMIRDCLNFIANNSLWLAKAGTPEQNGHDYWLTRERHGAGFWDRGYPAAVGKALTDAAHADGSQDLYLGDDDRVHVS